MAHYYTRESLERFLTAMESLRDVLPELKELEPKLDYQKLDYIDERLRFYRNKLVNNYIEVAFVGLEKVGKSSVINAIIGHKFLPADTKRATYTTTEVRYGEEPLCRISFYDYDSFIEEVFRPMLAQIDYPNYSSHTPETLRDLKTYFEKELKEKNKALYDEHFQKTRNDIEEIIEGWKEINALLTGSVQEYRGAKVEDIKDFIVSPYKSRAVKEIKIYTPALRELKNLIIYDLPGFDSPTYIHSEFTKDKIKKADAVVFIRDAYKPSLNVLELDTIQSTIEDDGISLSEKLFFFCNMVDRVPAGELEKVKSYLMDELDRKGLGDAKERVIYGSARARLESLGYERDSEAQEKLKRLGLSDGIDELMKAIVEFMKSEREKHLERKVATLVSQLKDMVESAIRKLERYIDISLSIGEEYKNINEKTRQAWDRVREHLTEVHAEIKVNYQDHKPISAEIKKKINNEFVFENLVSEEMLRKVRRKIEATTSTREALPDRFNRELRKEVVELVNRNFNQLVEASVAEDIQKVKEKLTEAVVKALEEVFGGISDREGLKASVQEYLEGMGLKINSYILGINGLIERFAGDIVQLFNHPISSRDRENKFREIIREIYSLASYGEDFDPQVPLSGSSLVLLLQHRDLHSVENELSKTLEEKRIQADRSTILDLALEILKTKNPSAVMLDILRNTQVKTIQDVMKIIKNHLEDVEDEQSPQPVVDKEQVYNEQVEEIRKDLEILQKILVGYVVNLLDVERGLMNMMTRVLALDREREPEDFVKFINQNLHRLMEKELGERLRKEELMKRANQVIIKLKDIQSNLKGA